MTFLTNHWQNRIRRLGYGLATAIALSGGIAMVAPTAGKAQVLLEEQGTLSPMQDEYPFDGEAGDAVAIAMDSEEFDTVLVLLGPNGEEVAFNDDYARSLNSTIITTLPTTGTYTIVARSFSGRGGQYNLVVRPATPYDMAYSEGYTSIRNGDLEGAIAAFSEAITLEPDRPEAYLERGDAYYGVGNIDAVIEDYTRAADLYEQAGDIERAMFLREQLTFIQ